MTTLGELAKVLELELRGDAARSIASLAALEVSLIAASQEWLVQGKI